MNKFLTILSVLSVGLASLHAQPGLYPLPLEDVTEWGEEHPLIEERGTVQASLGQAVRWPLTDPPVNARVYSAGGLPPGLRIDEASGEISGTIKLAGEFRVVIGARRDDADDPVALLGFHIDVQGPIRTLDPRRTLAGPEITVVRLPMEGRFTGNTSPAFEIPFPNVRLLDALPPGVIWDELGQISAGLPSEAGTTKARYHYSNPNTGVTQEGLLILLAETGADRQPVADGVTSLAYLGETLVNTDGAVLRSNGSPAIQAPWWTPLGGSATLHASADRVVALANGQNVYTYDGLAWSEAPIILSNARIHISQGAILVSGEDQAHFTLDNDSWIAIDPGELTDVRAAWHHEGQWLAISAGRVKTSADGIIWADRGELELGIPWTELQLTRFRNEYWLIARDPSLDSRLPNLYRSTDGIAWRTGPSLPGNLCKLISRGDQLWAATRETLYHWNEARDAFDVRWQALAGAVIDGLDVSEKGLIGVVSGGAAWQLDPSALPPQLQGSEAFPDVSHHEAVIGEPFLIQLESSDPETTFVDHHLPNGLFLDAATGEVSGSLDQVGTHLLAVGVRNAHGEGAPRVIRVIVHTGEWPVFLASNFFRYLSAPRFLATQAKAGNRLELLLPRAAYPDIDVEVSVRNLPPGRFFDPDSGEIGGDTAATGIFPLIIDLVTPQGRVAYQLPLVVFDWEFGQVEALSSSQQSAEDPIELFHRAVGNKGPVRFFAPNLPSGLTLNEQKGTISGPPLPAGAYDLLIGLRDAAGRIGAPHSTTLYLEEKRPSMIPPSQPLLLRLEDPSASAWSMRDHLEAGHSVAFLSLPPEISFVPPFTLVPKQPIAEGLYTGRLREWNESGFAEREVWMAVYQPSVEELPFDFDTGGPSPYVAVAGAPYRAALTGLIAGDRVKVAGFPPGITYDDTSRTLQGVSREVGEHRFAMMITRPGVRSLVIDYTIQVLPGSPSPESSWASYPVALAGRSVSWAPYGLGGNEVAFMSHDRPDAEPGDPYAGVFDQPGRHPVTWRYRDFPEGPAFPSVLTVYEPPQWDPARRRARRLPQGLNGDPAVVAVLEQGSTFGPAPALRFTEDGREWTTAPPPLGTEMPSFTDITRSPFRAVLSGDSWWAQSSQNYQFGPASEIGRGVTGIVTKNDWLVASTESGVFHWEGVRWARMGDTGERRSALALGNARIVAVGPLGSIATFDDTTRKAQALRSPVSANLKEVIFSGNEFIAVGDGGTVIRSPDGVEWTLDRAPAPLGADFRTVTANADWIVALAPWTTLAKRRHDEGGAWQPLERRRVQGSYLDTLTTPAGEQVSGFAEGLDVPRRSGGSTTLFSPLCQRVLVGEEIRSDIVALAGPDVVYRVEGLPEGLSFDRATGQLRGRFEHHGYYECLVEASSGGRTMGKTLLFDVSPVAPMLTRTSLDVVAGSRPITIPLTSPTSDGQRALEIQPPFRVGTHHQQVWLSNAAGGSAQTLTIRVHEPTPLFVTQPARLTTGTDGERVLLRAELQGQWPIHLQWLRNGEPVQDARETEFTIDSLSESTAGTYRLLASNALGETFSEDAVVRLESGSAKGYAAWAAERGLAPDGPFDDHNGDGQANVFDFLMEENRPRFVGAHDGSWEYHFQRRTEAEFQMTLEFSEDLRTWLPAESALAIEDLSHDRERARYVLPFREGFLRFALLPFEK